MKRSLVLGGLVVFGALSLALGQQGPKALEVEKLRDNLYVLRGIIDPATNSPRGGGNTAVFVTSSGVVVVDTKDPGWGQPILDTIKTLTPKPVTMIINTHSHGDHTSGNVEFPASVEIVAQEHTKANMTKVSIFTGDSTKFLPKTTYKNNTWVVFPAAVEAIYEELER